MKVSLCPSCGYCMTDSTHVGPEKQGDFKPRPGDTSSLCLNCGAILAFSDDLSLRAATGVEIEEILRDRKASSLVQRAQALIRKRGPLPKHEVKSV